MILNFVVGFGGLGDSSNENGGVAQQGGAWSAGEGPPGEGMRIINVI